MSKIKKITEEIHDELNDRGFDNMCDDIKKGARNYTLWQFVKDIGKFILFFLFLFLLGILGIASIT